MTAFLLENNIMKLIVGLGNPDDKYKNTFHNLGFMCVDKACEKLGVSITKSKCRALIGEYKSGKDKVIFAKPQTYMNLSGESVQELVSFYKIDLSDLLVVYDDYDLLTGSVRIRENGSAGTHNGMRNIVEKLGTGNFARLRVGFKSKEQTQIPLINYVLSGISKEDKPLFDGIIDNCANALIDFASGKDIQAIMRGYNLKV